VKADWKQWVLRLHLKAVSDLQSRTAGSKVFQILGAETWTAREPKLMRLRVATWHWQKVTWCVASTVANYLSRPCTCSVKCRGGSPRRKPTKNSDYRGGEWSVGLDEDDSKRVRDDWSGREARIVRQVVIKSHIAAGQNCIQAVKAARCFQKRKQGSSYVQARRGSCVSRGWHFKN